MGTRGISKNIPQHVFYIFLRIAAISAGQCYQRLGSRLAITLGPAMDMLEPHGRLLGDGFTIIAGSILDADETLIVHQCCCVLNQPAQGVASLIFKKWPAPDVYRQRREQRIPVDTPGELSKHDRIVNLFGQFVPGKAQPRPGMLSRTQYAHLCPVPRRK